MPKFEKKHKINGDVRFPQVRVIMDGDSKIMSSYEAYKIAESEEKDLILINENTNPPIVKIEDYKKFLYDQNKKDKIRKKNAKKVEVKEIVLSTVIADHDLKIKAKKAVEFLKEGDKVKCSLMMKGRENATSSRGQYVMLKFAELCEDFGSPEELPKLEGSKWLMTIRPKK